MRSRPWLASLAILALAAGACAAPSPAASPSGTPATPTEEASASPTPTEEPTEQPTQAATATAAAGGQLDFELPANYGSTDLTAGFTPDPFSVELVSGGPIDASYIPSCNGFVTAAPDFELVYTAGTQSLLRFYFVADTAEDTTLIVNDPVGRWFCNDDAEGTIDPQVDFANPRSLDPVSDEYDVWIGSYEAGAEISGTLYITEIATNRP